MSARSPGVLVASVLLVPLALLLQMPPRDARASVPGPPNDACILATPLGECDVTVPFDTAGATTDGNSHPACEAFGNDQIFNDVWYCWTAPQDAAVAVETCNLTALDTKIAAYGPFVDCNLAAATCTPGDVDLSTCNDDTCGLQSRVQFAAEAGQSYLIRVGSFDAGSTGLGDVSIACESPTAACADPGPLPASVCQEPDQVGGLLSDATSFRAAERVGVTVDTDVSRLRWWGAYADGVGDCGPGPGDGFAVTYYVDAGGLPGAVHAGPFPVQDLEKCTTGDTIASFFDEFQFEGTHPPVALAGGAPYWVEIANDTAGACRWFWATSGAGDGTAAQASSGPYGLVPGDLALCFQTRRRICRSAGFWSMHAGPDVNVTQEALDAGGGCSEICGETIRSTALDDADSALETLCVSVRGTDELQLARQLLATGLNCNLSGFGPLCTGWPGVEDLFRECNAVCEGLPDAWGLTVLECVDMLMCLNGGGDPFAVPGACMTGFCSDNGAPCSALELGGCMDPSLATCEPNPDDCHAREVCNDGVGICLPAAARAETRTCKRARSSACTVLEVGKTTEARCGGGVRLDDESCCLDAGECDDGDVCTQGMCIEGPGCMQEPIPNCCESDADCTMPSLPVCDVATNQCVAPTTTTTTSSSTSTSSTTSSSTSTSSTIVTVTTSTSSTTTTSTSTTTSTTIDPLPEAGDDAFDVLGNVSISVDAANGVLANDMDADGPVTVAAFDATSANGGDVNVNTDGGFTYDPPAGFEGTDTFGYTIEDTAAQTASATVTLTVEDMVWFIDNTAASGGDGRLSAPFDSLTAYASTAADEAGDAIFVFEGDGTTTNLNTGIVLLNDQRLVGEGVDLVTAAGLVPPTFSVTLPGAGSRPTIGNVAGAGINLASGNTVRGLDVDAQSGIVGTGVGAAVVSDVAVSSSSGPALILNGGGTVSLAFDSVTAGNGGGHGVSLQSLGGTTTFAALNVTNGSGTGFLAANAGTVEVTGAANTIATTMGVGIDLTNTTIGAGGVTFRSVAAGGAANGIVLSNTGTGAFTVTGDGATAGSGGTIQNATGDGISLVSASNVSLGFMTVASNAGNGIFGNDLTNFSLTDTTVQDNADAVGEAGLRFMNLLGTCTIADSVVSGSFEDNIRMTPTSGTLSLLTIDNTTVGPNPVGTGGNGLTILTTGTASTTVSIENGSQFVGNQASGVLTTYGGSGVQDISIANGTFMNNNIGVDLGGSGSGNWTFDVSGNALTGQKTDAIFVVQGSDSTSTATGTISTNQIGNGTTDSGARDQFGIHVDARSGAMVVAVTNNTVRNTDFDGIFIETRETLSSVGVATMDLTLTDNTVFPPDDNSAFPLGLVYGTRVESRDTTSLCANVVDNDSQGSGAGTGYRLRERDTSSFSLQGFTTNVVTTLTNNGNTTNGLVPTVSTTGEPFAGGCTPATP